MVVLMYFLFLLAGNAFANEEANKFIDNMLNTTFLEQIKSLMLDPAPLADFSVEFNETVKVFGTVKGRADFEKGTLKGLLHPIRLNECQGSFQSASRSVNCTIAWKNLKVKFEGKLKYGKMPRMSIKGKGKLNETHSFLDIMLDANKKYVMKKYSCTKLGVMDAVKWTGLGPFNRFVRILDEGFKERVYTQVFNAMDDRLRYAIIGTLGSL